jgi:hypothetical protein
VKHSRSFAKTSQEHRVIVGERLWGLLAVVNWYFPLPQGTTSKDQLMSNAVSYVTEVQPRPE